MATPSQTHTNIMTASILSRSANYARADLARPMSKTP